MDLRQYYKDLRETEAKLEREFPSGEVHVTSLFHRERASTAGSTVSATCRNAARVITDGTHRLANEDEIREFLLHQQRELRKNTLMEQQKKRQYITVIAGEEDPVEAITGVPGMVARKGVRIRQGPATVGEEAQTSA
jgi:hypothetical protein